MSTNATQAVTVNLEQKLFVIPTGDGYSCLGFDVCAERTAKYAKWLKVEIPAESEPRGTLEAYAAMNRLMDQIRAKCVNGLRCDAELEPQLVGLEKRRVEVVDCYGTTRRFYVGRSMGWMPIHLEIAKCNSISGGQAWGTPYKSVRVIR